MAKTRAQWEAEYAAAAIAEGASTSTAAEWLLIRNIYITLLMLLERIVEFFKADVDESLKTKQPGSVYWYPIMIKEFQYGDSLTVDNGTPKYAVIDPTKQIVTQVSVRESDDGKLLVKVAKDDAGNKVPLDNAELTALRNYAASRKSPGVKANVVSRAADSLKYTIIGKFDRNYAQATIEAAIDAVLETFRDNFAFDAILYKSQLVEDLMAIPGMKSVQVQIDITYGIGGSALNITEEAELPAGYFNYDVTSVKTLTAA